ncbi:hypothetical protein BABINDRAFT_181907 [Babjeviella inositovora NRRL Y-12698]|uniref:Myosin motor domain-containing protein n=1 Tax=Babjeviella inositovora NRRL Y-12698 TaxID=984486 RepID=A0A1E3QHE4_9ASCO|nr:uncharacterized protein BABINDRAFT_181907 [Babjeviella inositovora NRRL Y-12698]ODQ77115.1 hypothetical protein BABINDRAFT_181907 [Babjeviella inositovora NRRL Y-12698]
MSDLNSKDYVWIADKAETFARACIVLTDGDMVRVRKMDSTDEVTVAIDATEKCNPPNFDKCDDMAELTHLNEPSVVHNLRQRYADDLIYTYSGLFLVAVNPYAPLAIYDENYVSMYHDGDLKALKPHIFAITERTYQNVRAKRKNQSILVTGESGAGKTENTKKIIQYLSSITHQAKSSNIEEKILQANPILESFGNAQTIRNHNSSRFGKFIRIEFASGQIVGANIDWYLLEKSRVLKQTAKERNFHIFYQFLSGLPKNKRAELGLDGKGVRDFAYLRDSNPTIPHIDDRAEFGQLLTSFRIMGFNDAEIHAIFRTLALILHLGNIDFMSMKADQAQFARGAPVDRVAEMAGFPADAFTTAVLRPKVKAGKEFVTQSRTPFQARATIDAVAKMLYERIFRFIVDKINEELVLDETRATGESNFIGVLDIAGFEIFTKNSFEQLCINYTNERLQQFFNHHMFILEQNEYLKENINWKFIDFGNDLQPTIDLIDARGKQHGVMALLDEECIVPRATDRSFLEKLVKNWGEPKNAGKTLTGKFSQNKFKTGFIIHHYAGKVDYDVDQWLEKNKDPVSEAIMSLLGNSTDPFLAALFPATPSLSGKRNNMLRTVGTKHKEQLADLMDQLSSTTPHFVRCILPNNMKLPKKFDKQLVLDQLRCNGVLEGIRIARSGYPNRIFFKDFLPRYSIFRLRARIE